MSGGPGRLYRNIHPDHEEIVTGLQERFAHLRLRMDSGFVGSVPVQCTGRIGRRYFYFRFRGDTASLTVGSADHRGEASRAKHARRKALRTLRRDTGADDADIFGSFVVRSNLRRSTGLGRHPSRAAWYAVRHDVTGERWAGELFQEEAAELFIDLLNTLQPAGRAPDFRRIASRSRASKMLPMGHTPGIIRKPSRTRR